MSETARTASSGVAAAAAARAADARPRQPHARLERQGGCVFTPRIRYWEDFALEVVERDDSAAWLALLRGWGELEPGAMLFFACIQRGLAALRYLVGEGLVGVAADPELLHTAVDSSTDVVFVAEMLWPGRRLGPDVALSAARNLPLLQWMAGQEAGPEVSAPLAAALSEPELAAGAVEGGELELVTWLRGRGCVWDKAAFTAVARAGNPMLEWMAAEAEWSEARGLHLVVCGGGGVTALEPAADIDILDSSLLYS